MNRNDNCNVVSTAFSKVPSLKCLDGEPIVIRLQKVFILFLKEEKLELNEGR